MTPIILGKTENLLWNWPFKCEAIKYDSSHDDTKTACKGQFFLYILVASTARAAILLECKDS